MISTIIFSKNRACQLDLLLRSIFQNLPIFDQIRILYTYTNKEFCDGYQKVIEKFSQCLWFDQTEFEFDVKFLLSKSSNCVCFFVDDDIVYRKPKLDEDIIEKILLSNEGAACFSLRLGVNTTIQDPYTAQPVIPMPNLYQFKHDDCEAFLGWVWSQLPMNNFGYPFSVDGHIYNTEMLIPMLDYEFDNPNALEGRFDRNKLPKKMFSLYESCVVNNPLNIVGSSENKAGVYYNHSLESLNTSYLKGKIIDLDFLSNNKIVGCHQEMEIRYEENNII